MLYKDEWLSSYFSQGAYRYDSPFEENKFPKGFICAKVPLQDNGSVKKLLLEGFQLIEVLATFAQNEKSKVSVEAFNNCQYAVDEDKEQILDIADNAFTYTRFHKDPNISNTLASEIKRDWVANYFCGNRGSHMIIAKQDSTVMGFMLMLDQVIDLIAVSQHFLRKGVALNMIAFANQEIGLLTAGTQLDNKPSIQLYQKAGFALKDSVYVLHKHGI